MPVTNCAACGFANPAGALYCGSCGTGLGRPCPSCGTLVGEGLAFCTACGTALAGVSAESPAIEERKIVSVVFVDLVGFTGLVETLDPEDVRGVLDPYHARAKAELERFGGTVEKFIGDAVVAVFGAPVAHEDDPERAVRAALAVREAIAELNADDSSLELAGRLGVATGEALVNVNARPERGEALAAGDVLNTASRLQAGAPVNGVLVDEATHRATAEAIDYAEAEPVDAKGKAQPVTAWEAVAPRARLGVDIAFRGGAPLVGRNEELSALRDAFGRAQRERAAQLVTLVGVPGIGKSRLVYELWAAFESDSEVFAYWRQGRSLPYGDGVSFWALGEMTKAQAGILESDEAAVAEEKLRGAVAQVIADPEQARWVEGHLRPLVGLGGETDGGDRRGEAFAAWRRFLEGLAEQHPLVLVFEDVHWADEGLLEFVDHLLDWATDVPLLVVCTARPELLERRPDWGGGKRNSITLSLSALSDADTEVLVETLVGEAKPELIARAGGNPLYAEEYARMHAQSGNGGSLALPDSVQGIIAARLDTLPAEEKALVQDAAVLGKVFWNGALQHVAGIDARALEERLHALERKEFVRRERRSSVAGETAYVFRHALVRDVAYGQIPRGRRVEKHRMAAGWVESLAGDRREDLADVVAHHYSSALELARSAGHDLGDLVDRARHALREAGDRAAGLSALEAASRFYRDALELWPEDDPDYPALLFRHGRVLHPRGRGEDVLARAAEELLDAGHLEEAAEAEALLGEVLWIQGHREDAFDHLVGAVERLAGEPPSRAKAFVVADLARFRMIEDRAADAVALASEALAMAEALDLVDLRAHTLNTLGLARVSTGDLGGLDDIERAIADARDQPSFELSRGLNNLATLHFALGDLDRAYELYAESAAVAEKLGWTAALFWLVAERAGELFHRGRWDDAVAVTGEILEEAVSGVPHLREIDGHMIRALVRLARDDAGGALEDSAEALAFARESPDPQMLFPALAARARVLVETDAPEEAEPLVVELLDRWRSSPNTLPSSWLACAAPAVATLGHGGELVEIAKRAALRTRWLDAAVALAGGDPVAAAGIYAEIGSLPDEACARLHAAEELAAAGRHGEAEDELARARGFFSQTQALGYQRRAEAVPARSA